MVDALVKLHKTPPSIVVQTSTTAAAAASSSSSKPVSKSFYQRQIQGLSQLSVIQGNVTGDQGDAVGQIPQLDFIISWFLRHQVQEEVSIVHGDFKVKIWK